MVLRILGKLGGRNRRLLDREPELNYNQVAEPAKVLIPIGRDLDGIVRIYSCFCTHSRLRMAAP